MTVTSGTAAQDSPPDPAPGPAATAADPAATTSAATSAAAEPLSTRVRRLAEAVGPTTLVTALLIYFGYVATRARFAYFGVSLELTGLSNQSLLLYGLEVVYVPATLAFLIILVMIGLHAAVSWRLGRSAGDVTNSFLAAGFVLVGLLLLARAVIGIFVLETTENEPLGTTPLALAFGPAAVAYGVWVHGRNRSRPVLTQTLARSGIACTGGLVVAGLFWAATEFAWAYGTGRGEGDAADIAERPEIVLDTRERLVGLPPAIAQTALDSAGEASFAYRYEGFRLLLASGDRLFLIPATWQHGVDRTVVLPYDGDVRLQLIAQR